MKIKEFLDEFRSDVGKFEQEFDASEISDVELDETGFLNTMFNYFATGRIEVVKEEVDDNYYRSMGEFFGYPDCCISEFVARVNDGMPPNQYQSKVSMGTGFIPCMQHTQEILEGRTTLEELISDRYCPKKFPND